MGKEPYLKEESTWLVIYDGYCKLCSRSVQWIIRNDPQKRFSFMPLQEALSLQFHAWPGFPQDLEIASAPGEETVLLVVDGVLYDRSDAALRIAGRLRFPWPLLTVFYVIPRFIRDGVYRLVAQNRKRWFGEHSTCYLP